MPTTKVKTSHKTITACTIAFVDSSSILLSVKNGSSLSVGLTGTHKLKCSWLSL